MSSVHMPAHTHPPPPLRYPIKNGTVNVLISYLYYSQTLL